MSVAIIRAIDSTIRGPYAAVLSIIGIVLNTFSVYVFKKGEKGPSPAIHLYLIVLTLWHTGVLIFVLWTSVPYIIYGNPLPSEDYKHIYAFVRFANSICTFASNWVIIALTVDRFLALCHPLKHRAFCTRSRVKRALIAISLLSVICTIPKVFERKMIKDCSNKTCKIGRGQTDLYNNSFYWVAYHIIFDSICQTIGPCILVCVLTFRITVALRRQLAARDALLAASTGAPTEMEKNKNKELKANVLLVVIILKYIPCSVLPQLNALLRFVIGPQNYRGFGAAMMYFIPNALSLLEISTNFIFFMIYGAKFRRTCLRIIAESWIGRLFNMEIDPNEGNNSTRTTNLTSSSDKKKIREEEKSKLVATQSNDYKNDTEVIVKKGRSASHQP